MQYQHSLNEQSEMLCKFKYQCLSSLQCATEIINLIDLKHVMFYMNTADSQSSTNITFVFLHWKQVGYLVWAYLTV